jgi:hypothetical protein
MFIQNFNKKYRTMHGELVYKNTYNIYIYIKKNQTNKDLAYYKPRWLWIFEDFKFIYKL